MNVPVSLHPSLFDYSHSLGGKWYLIMVLIGISLVANVSIPSYAQLTFSISFIYWFMAGEISSTCF